MIKQIIYFGREGVYQNKMSKEEFQFIFLLLYLSLRSDGLLVHVSCMQGCGSYVVTDTLGHRQIQERFSKV
jgi:hypothetical protein